MIAIIPKNRIIPLILAVALFMEMMDSTVIATSLPAIASDIGTEPIALKLALTSYLVALAIFIPISGWLSDRFGARNVFRWAIFIFMVGSVACALAGSLPSFVLARFLQGMGGSMMAPIGRLLLLRTTEKKDLVSAMAWVSIPALLGPLTGPPLGGFLTTYFSWHWIFIINVPIGVVGIALASRFLPKLGIRNNNPIDMKGFLLMGMAFSGIVFGLSVVSLPALPEIYGVVTLIIGLVSGYAYLRHARKVDNPLLDPKIFRNRVFRVSIVGPSIFRLGIGATPFLLPLMLQIGYGLSPFDSGIITFIGAAGAISMKFFASSLYRRFGFRIVLSGALILCCVILAITGYFSPESQLGMLLFILFVSGFSRSLFFTGANAFGFSEVKDDETAQATAINSVFQQVSMAMGVALAGGMLELSAAMRGSGLDLVDFKISLIIISVIAAFGAIPYMRLPRDAGSLISGHRVN